jgi:hypothetical protein
MLYGYVQAALVRKEPILLYLVLQLFWRVCAGEFSQLLLALRVYPLRHSEEAAHTLRRLNARDSRLLGPGYSCYQGTGYSLVLQLVVPHTTLSGFPQASRRARTR